MVDLETLKFDECEILEANRGKNMENNMKKNMEKYIGHDWYEYAKKKKLRVGNVVFYLPLNFRNVVCYFEETLKKDEC